jgi:toxin ParE1/3/4
MKLRLLPEAENDIGEIAVYIAYDDKTAALRWVDAINQKCSKLVDTPGLGVARDDVAPGLRMLPSGNYVILYR